MTTSMLITGKFWTQPVFLELHVSTTYLIFPLKYSIDLSNTILPNSTSYPKLTTSPVIPFFYKFHPLSYSLYFLFFTAKYFPKILLWVYHLNISNPILCLLPFQKKKKSKRSKQTTTETKKSKHNTKQRLGFTKTARIEEC